MKFTDLLDKLKNGKTFEEIATHSNVECIGNMVYEDEDLYTFLRMYGDAHISYYHNGYAIIVADDIICKVPYEEHKNRFDEELGNETILFFDFEKIY